MKKIRVLATREKRDGATVAAAVCLEHFVVGQGGNDAEALTNMLNQIRGHQEFGDFDSLAPAHEDYVKKFTNSTRESQVARGEFLVQCRSG